MSLSSKREPLSARALKTRAVAWLATREYTRAELAQKLLRLAQAPEDVEQVLDDLERQGWQSDARFAQSFSHVKAAKQGAALIAQGLRRKGVDPSLIASTLDSLGASELERAQAVWRKKFGATGVAQDAKERARQARFLAGRGFAGEVIWQVLGQPDEMSD